MVIFYPILSKTYLNGFPTLIVSLLAIHFQSAVFWTVYYNVIVVYVSNEPPQDQEWIMQFGRHIVNIYRHAFVLQVLSALHYLIFSQSCVIFILPQLLIVNILTLSMGYSFIYLIPPLGPHDTF